MSAAAAVLVPVSAMVQADKSGTAFADIAQLLTGPRQTIEKVFLEMGQDLLDCTRLLGEVSTAHKGIPQELESAAFGDVEKTLTSIREDVLAMSAARTQEVECLDRLAAMAHVAATPIHALRKTVRTITLVAVNARVTAATTKGNERELSTFTTDIRELTQSVEQSVDSFVEAYSQFAHDLATARSASAAFAERHGTTMAGISNRLTAHLNYFAGYRQTAARSADEHTTLAGQIRSRVAQAVSTLQIGDMTRQRVEHVEEGLAMLDERSLGAAPLPGEDTDTLATAASVLSAQLDDTCRHFEHEIIVLARSLHHLAGDADKVLNAGNREAATAFSNGEAALASIIDNLAEIGTIFRDFIETRTQMEQIAGKVARSVAAMVDRLAAVAQIELQIRLLSFNTAIQCAKLGENGHALRVIAHSLREIVGETVSASAAILEALASAQDLAQGLIEGEAAGLAQRIASLETDTGGAVDLLGQVSGRLRTHVSTMTAVGPQAVKQLHAAADHAKGQRSLGARLHAAQAEILALAPHEADPSAIDLAFFTRLRSKYTMDSERRIHDSVLGAPAQATASDDSASTAEAGLDDIFF